MSACAGERLYGYWSRLFGSFLTNFLLCLSLTVQSFCTWNSFWFPQGYRTCDFWHSLWEVWHFHLLWHFFLWPGCGGGGWATSGQRPLPRGVVQHAAPPLGCSLPFRMGQSHESQPARRSYPQHQHAYDRWLTSVLHQVAATVFADFRATLFFNDCLITAMSQN